MTVNDRPDFRREFYRLGVGISGDRRHQDKIVGRNMLQGRKGASGDGKHVLSKRVIAKRAQHEVCRGHGSPCDGGNVPETQRHSYHHTSE